MIKMKARYYYKVKFFYENNVNTKYIECSPTHFPYGNNIYQNEDTTEVMSITLSAVAFIESDAIRKVRCMSDNLLTKHPKLKKAEMYDTKLIEVKELEY